MPGLTIQTEPAAHGPASGMSSPTRPPMSPITPPQVPTQLPSSTTGIASTNNNNNNSQAIPDFSLGRPAFTHSQPDQVGVAPPAAAEPIAFDDNPDVLALKSAISILQLQRARATADIQALGRAKAAALADPGAFVADLAAGQVGVEGDPLMFPGVRGGISNGGDDSFPPSSSSEEEGGGEEGDDGDDEDSGEGMKHVSTAPSGPLASAADAKTPDARSDGKVATATTARRNKKRKGKQKSATAPAAHSAWNKLPKPQTIVRCPPINWAQYGVVGESLDKLHAEQTAAPTPGVPAVLGLGGTFEFKASDQSSSEPPRRLVGIAAPYAPGKDRIEKKAKGAKR